MHAFHPHTLRHQPSLLWHVSPAFVFSRIVWEDLKSFNSAVFAFSRAWKMVFQLLHVGRCGTKCTAGVLDCRWNWQHRSLERWAPSLWAESTSFMPRGEDKLGTPQWQLLNAFPTTPHLVGKAFLFPPLDLSFHQICSQLAKRVTGPAGWDSVFSILTGKRALL